MKILFAASEAAPFLKTGGLGDVAAALPKALSAAPHTEVCVFLPYYKAIKTNPAFEMQLVAEFNVPLGWRNQYCGLFRAIGRKKKLQYYFLAIRRSRFLTIHMFRLYLPMRHPQFLRMM